MAVAGGLVRGGKKLDFEEERRLEVDFELEGRLEVELRLWLQEGLVEVEGRLKLETGGRKFLWSLEADDR